MASAPQSDLPLFYKRLEPLSSNVHGQMKLRMIGGEFATDTHAVPLTAEEFGLAQRFYPIVFSTGPNPVPLALTGLNEGVNTFFDAEGKTLDEDGYLPAYIRRYPFMLAKLFQDRDELTLCFDPTADAVGEHEGETLFDGTEPSQATRNILTFCEQFETAGQRTQAFVKELQDLKLLIDGEVTIQPEGAQPFVYRGFQMVSEDALRDLRGDVARRLIQSGAMPLIYAHLFSLARVQDLFARQQRQGKGPSPVPLAPAANEPVGA
ncbi:SapC family protein [Sphingomonas jatrophae]|uniref:SapC protein n=1 Tax=Sphingomonas jatrophae TaxID=1166337 RepID=A0A1I6JT62_9SPHN|nr:SapC family protein [Sphingomonas jatrophae]SFR82133.1 SapC protein [Sphingomonas jatrophae]